MSQSVTNYQLRYSFGYSARAKFQYIQAEEPYTRNVAEELLTMF